MPGASVSAGSASPQGPLVVTRLALSSGQPSENLFWAVTQNKVICALETQVLAERLPLSQHILMS